MENGKVAIATNLKNGIGFGSTEFHVIRPKDESISREYLFYYLLQRDFRKNAQRNMAGSAGQLRVPARFLQQFIIPFPPIDEQSRIAARIEELFTKIDAGITALKKARAQLNLYRKSVLKYAFEGKLTSMWRKETRNKIESAAFFLERIKEKRTSNSDKNQGLDLHDLQSLPAIPDSWSWTNIGTLFDVKPGGTPSRRVAKFWNGSIPWISSGEVANCYISSTEEHITETGVQNSNAKVHPPGTVLLAMIGEGKTRGQAAILKIAAATNQNVASILCADSIISSEWIFYWLLKRYNETRRQGSGGMQPALNTNRVRQLPIPIAPIEEQNIIIEQIECHMSYVDAIDSIVNYSLKQVDSLRISILRMAFEGKLVLQDPSDQPATILLQKIRAEKAKHNQDNRIRIRPRTKVKAKWKQTRLV